MSAIIAMGKRGPAVHCVNASSVVSKLRNRFLGDSGPVAFIARADVQLSAGCCEAPRWLALGQARDEGSM